MLCPVCNGEMYDNRARKLNPKAPDFRCKDGNCKYSLNPDTGEYESGDFITGVWLKKEVEKHETGLQREVKEKPRSDEYVEGKKENTALMCRKDLMVAIVNHWLDPVDTRIIIETFNILWKEIEK